MTDKQFFKKYPTAPYRSVTIETELYGIGTIRVPNPALSQMIVTAKGKLAGLAPARALVNYKYPVAVPIPDYDYEGPVLFDKSGKYTLENRKIRSLDGTAAVRVWNGAEVEIKNCVIVGCGNLVEAAGNAALYIHHNDFYGDTPANGGQWGRVLNMYHPKALMFENNYVEHTGGILLDHTEPGSKPTVVIRFNRIRNTDKRKADTTDGDHRASILFNTVLPARGEISWNIFENEMGISHVEDNINLYNSGGSEEMPFIIQDNLVYGAYPYPLSASFYTGSGITIDGDPGTNQLANMSQWVNIYNNTIVSTCNACMNIAAGHDIHSFMNTYISAGMFPDGTLSQRFWGGCCIWDASNVGANFKNNDQKNNVIGYARPGVNLPFAGRQDWVIVADNPLSIKAGDNYSLPNPITLTTEDGYIKDYYDKVAKQGIKIGNVAGEQPPVENNDEYIIKVFEEKGFQIIAADATGKAAGFKAGTLIATSDIYTDTEVINETVFVKGVSAGKSVVTVSLHTNADKVLTKSFAVNVIALLPEATQIIIKPLPTK